MFKLQRRMNKDVVIVGCGFIGKIKAKVWCALGLNVYVYDLDKSQEEAVIQLDPRIKSFTAYSQGSRPTIVDIATPNNKHGDALVWASQHISSAESVVIEKPICSTEQERRLIERTLAALPNTNFYINETYYWSEALSWLAKRLTDQGEKPEIVTVNLSKNRLADVLDGRFFDKELQAYGIEMPHAIAILQVLGIDVFQSKVKQNVQYADRAAQLDANQGVDVKLISPQGVVAQLRSFLGDYSIESDKITPNELRRSVIVDTLSDRYTIEFDPVEGEKRYTSRITIESSGERILMEDNHLMNHMRNVRDNAVDNRMTALLSPKNSFEIYSFLSKLMQTADVRMPSGAEINFVTGREKD